MCGWIFVPVAADKKGRRKHKRQAESVRGCLKSGFDMWSKQIPGNPSGQTDTCKYPN